MQRYLFAAVFLGGVSVAGAAQARLQPEAPPSGIVVHLFGPDSVLRNVAPALASAPVGPQAGGSRAEGSQSVGSQAVGSQAGVSPAGAQTEPSWGNVLHQMFVTGDPDSPNQPAPGKIGHQLSN